MKVLFLDIDGVCNSAETQMRQYEKTGKGGLLMIDEYLASIAKGIIERTGCKLVISSSWRGWDDGMAQIKDMVHPDIYGETPHLKSGYRGDEVNAWLKQNPEVTRYAILDDDSDFQEYQPLFKTTWAIGITHDIADRVVEYLND